LKVIRLVGIEVRVVVVLQWRMRLTSTSIYGRCQLVDQGMIVAILEDNDIEGLFTLLLGAKWRSVQLLPLAR